MPDLRHGGASAGLIFFFSSRRRHTRSLCDWSSDVCSSDLFGTERINATSQLASWDGKLVGRVFELPAGDVDFAIGASWRREALSGHADANGRVTDPVTHFTGGNAQLWVLGFNFDPFAAH